MRSYSEDRQWADQYIPAIRQIISEVSGVILDISPAPDQEDMEHAIDLVINVEAGKIACRLRRVEYASFKDLTIRKWRKNSVPTEFDKITKKTVRWYLYAYIDDVKREIVDWYLIDVFSMLDSQLLAGRTLTYNKDGTTAFISIPLQELENAGCIVASQMKPKLTQFAKLNIAQFHSAYTGQQGGI